jgi:hypothetical protein
MNRAGLMVLPAVVLLAGCHRLAAPGRTPAWVLTDPVGDDHGDGELLLPGKGEPGPGELDLVALRAYPGPDGLELEAEFARPIRRPDVRVIAPTGETLEDASPLGFWTFNLDLYVDLDRVPGSGRTDTLPGRLAVIAPETAWERVICLTPRPAEARARLAGMWRDAAERRLAEAKTSIGGAEAAALEQSLRKEAEEKVWFPRQAAISGPRIRFSVPAAFLPPDAAARAAWVAVVTAATPDQRVDVQALMGRASTAGLFNLGVGAGVQLDRLGGGRINDPDQPPTVDVLLDGSQEEALRARPAVLRGVVPTPRGAP